MLRDTTFALALILAAAPAASALAQDGAPCADVIELRADWEALSAATEALDAPEPDSAFGSLSTRVEHLWDFYDGSPPDYMNETLAETLKIATDDADEAYSAWLHESDENTRGAATSAMDEVVSALDQTLEVCREHHARMPQGDTPLAVYQDMLRAFNEGRSEVYYEGFNSTFCFHNGGDYTPVKLEKKRGSDALINAWSVTLVRESEEDALLWEIGDVRERATPNTPGKPYTRLIRVAHQPEGSIKEGWRVEAEVSPLRHGCAKDIFEGVSGASRDHILWTARAIKAYKKHAGTGEIPISCPEGTEEAVDGNTDHEYAEDGSIEEYALRSEAWCVKAGTDVKHGPWTETIESGDSVEDTGFESYIGVYVEGEALFRFPE